MNQQDLVNRVRFDERGQVLEVRCPGCGNPIRAHAATDITGSTVTPDGKIVLLQKHELVSMPSYREVHLECSFNGVLSKHVTNACADCASTFTLDDWQTIHDADMAADHLLVNRTVRRVLSVNQGGVA